MKFGSMLINHNNGSGSRIKDCSISYEGVKPEKTNFLEICLDSYFRSIDLRHPLVVIDDGSTDDSVSILKRYESRFDEFVCKKKNQGLGKAINEAARLLIDKHSCDVICRFDGDVEFLTPGWDLRFSHYFQTHMETGAVGGAQILPNGALWSMGDMIIHPEGYHHILGVKTDKNHAPLNEPIMMSHTLQLGEMICDSVMGCLAAFRSDAFDRVGGIRPEFHAVRGQTEDLNLRLLETGLQCAALGSVVFIHRHIEHAPKTAVTDQSSARREDHQVWRSCWGWDKRKPDLELIHKRWENTLLARNLYRDASGHVHYTGP